MPFSFEEYIYQTKYNGNRDLKTKQKKLNKKKTRKKNTQMKRRYGIKSVKDHENIETENNNKY